MKFITAPIAGLLVVTLINGAAAQEPVECPLGEADVCLAAEGRGFTACCTYTTTILEVVANHSMCFDNCDDCTLEWLQGTFDNVTNAQCKTGEIETNTAESSETSPDDEAPTFPTCDDLGCPGACCTTNVTLPDLLDNLTVPTSTCLETCTGCTAEGMNSVFESANLTMRVVEGTDVCTGGSAKHQLNAALAALLVGVASLAAVAN